MPIDETNKLKRKKASLNVTVNPRLKRQLEELVEGEDFASLSDVVQIACQEFIIRYKLES